jgi:hypothetical protein
LRSCLLTLHCYEYSRTGGSKYLNGNDIVFINKEREILLILKSLSVGNINDKLFDATDNVDNALIIRSDKFTNNANYNNDVIFYELTSPLGSPPYYGMILPHGEDEFLILINDMNRINKVGTVGGN